jgi:hypothetical protein
VKQGMLRMSRDETPFLNSVVTTTSAKSGGSAVKAKSTLTASI